MEIVPAIGVGVSDLQAAARIEVQRILKESRGSPLAQNRLLLSRLVELGLIDDKESKALNQLAKLGSDAGNGKMDATKAYHKSRDIHNSLLINGNASPVALVIGSSAVGSYQPTDSDGDSPAVVYAKSSGEWETRGAAAGAIIGATWGPMGAAIGGAVGGIVGAAVDECIE